jgi:hypothetical protein
MRNLEELVEESKMRDQAVLEICKTLDMIDDAALVRVLAHIADRIALWPADNKRDFMAKNVIDIQRKTP